jgi:ABC-2 type transport system ATP-binding protein
MKRKLEIMRSLMHRPKILFLDEPTTGLDPVSRRNLWTYIQKVRKEQCVTVFLTTHYLEEAEGSDQICVMDKGEILVMGTPEELKKHWNTKTLEDAYIKMIYKRHQEE